MQKQREFTTHILSLKDLLKNILQEIDKLTYKEVAEMKEQWWDQKLIKYVNKCNQWLSLRAIFVCTHI